MAENKVIIDGKDREKENDYILQVNHLTKAVRGLQQSRSRKADERGKNQG